MTRIVIELKKETRDRLKERKIFQRETYDEIIERLLEPKDD